MNNIFGNAQVRDSALVFGSAQVRGNAQVCDSALVCDSAQVYGEARVCGDGLIKSDSDYILVGPMGVDHRWLTAHRDAKIGVRVNRPGFSGTPAEFRKRFIGDEIYSAMIEAHFAAMGVSA